MENILFDAYKSKNLDLKNRIVMAPMTRSRSDNPENKRPNLQQSITNRELLPF